MLHLSAKHGLNAGTMNCFFCNEPKGIIMHGAIGHLKAESLRESGIHVPEDGSAPRNIVVDMEPCEKCAEYMKLGVILISVKDEEPKDPMNPYRTGGWVVVKPEFIQRVVTPDSLAENILKKRMAFIPDAAWNKLGLPPVGSHVGLGSTEGHHG